MKALRMTRRTRGAPVAARSRRRPAGGTRGLIRGGPPPFPVRLADCSRDGLHGWLLGVGPRKIRRHVVKEKRPRRLRSLAGHSVLRHAALLFGAHPNDPPANEAETAGLSRSPLLGVERILLLISGAGLGVCTCTRQSACLRLVRQTTHSVERRAPMRRISFERQGFHDKNVPRGVYRDGGSCLWALVPLGVRRC